MSKVLPTLDLFLIAFVCAVTVTAQLSTDFSGDWVLEDPVQPPVDVPQRIGVVQRIADPGYKDAVKVMVELQYADRVHYATFHVGPDISDSGGLSSSTRGPRIASRGSIRPQGSALRFEERRWNADTGAVLFDHTRIWRLDDKGRLVVTEEDSLTKTTFTSIYRRENVLPRQK